MGKLLTDSRNNLSRMDMPVGAFIESSIRGNSNTEKLRNIYVFQISTCVIELKWNYKDKRWDLRLAFLFFKLSFFLILSR
jgi:hypothetical protein